jgi:tRNA(fMet)-specific endonuclease VapC
MSRFLLDTNIISDAARNPGGIVDGALRARLGEEIGTSLIVKGEILYGLDKNADARGRKRLEVLLQSIPVWELQEPVSDVYGEIRARAERNGRPLGPNDLWIAAHALTLDATLVTDDQGFATVEGLKVENWLRPSAMTSR